MKPQHTLGQASTPDGGEIVLYERDGAYFIRVNGLELMTSRAHGSEEDLARLALAKLKRKKPKVLVGGLGMGFTLRAVLDAVPMSAKVMVAEILPAVIAWNRKELAHLAGSPLEDPRVAVVERDVAEIIAAGPSAFDAVLLDVDNGPAALTVAENERLYGPSGLAATRATFNKPEEHLLLPEIISKEPLGGVVRHGDDNWADVVRWMVSAV
ncbi:MAG: hypothetical protein ABFS02_13635, partial [Pseudomonadota bacterium]